MPQKRIVIHFLADVLEHSGEQASVAGQVVAGHELQQFLKVVREDLHVQEEQLQNYVADLIILEGSVAALSGLDGAENVGLGQVLL